MLKYLDTSPKATFNIWTDKTQSSRKHCPVNWHKLGGPCYMYEQIEGKRRIMGDLDNKERCMNL